MIYKEQLVFIMFIYVCVLLSTNGSSLDCAQNTRPFSYLDVAVDLIQKAKRAYQACPGSNSMKAMDCEELYRVGQNKSGAYVIWPRNRMLDGKPLDVYCDMTTDGGGWTVLQRRGDYNRPNDYFYQNWASYKAGFGNIEQDFWLGNDNIYALTNQRLYSVRFDLKAVDGSIRYAVFDTFWIDDETYKYTLHIKDYRGDAGNSMVEHDGMKFSTKDIDNDKQDVEHCAQLYKGGWWYNACHAANLNGMYFKGKHDSFANGVNWKTWKDYHESLEFTEIKIRTKNFRKQAAVQQPLPIDSSEI